MYATKPIAEPAARTVLAHNIFSAVRGSTVGTGTIGRSFVDWEGEELMVKVPTNVWMSFIGGSAADAGFSGGTGKGSDGSYHIFRHQGSINLCRNAASGT